MTEKYIWLVGGSVMAEPMCKEIKRRGYRIILTDQAADCHCRPLADMFCQLSVYDAAEHVGLAALTPQKIAAVLTIGTDAGPTVSALSSHFGLPGIGYDKAALVKDKIRMRQKLNLPEPYFFVYSGGQPGYFEPDKFPMAVKAPDQAGSKGFDIAQDNPGLHQIIADRGNGDLLLEQLLDGEDMIPEWRGRHGFATSEATFDFFIEDGEVIYANGALRLFRADQPGIEAGHINPFEAVASKEDMRQIMSLAQTAADGLGLVWGVLKIDAMKDTRYGWCLLECATRLSGGFDHMYTSPLATGRDVTGVMLDVALGQRVDRQKLEDRKGEIACAYAPRHRTGKFTCWNSFPERSGHEHIFFLAKDEIKRLVSNQDRPFFIITRGQTADNALRLAMKGSKFHLPRYS